MGLFGKKFLHEGRTPSVPVKKLKKVGKSLGTLYMPGEKRVMTLKKAQGFKGPEGEEMIRAEVEGRIEWFMRVM